jgi:uncharacterized DUF497 family protein
MEGFEFNEFKSWSNRKKHGIDFKQAQLLWEDSDLTELSASSEGEKRSLFIGRIYNRHWTAVVTYRKHVIRLISVRRARKKEVEIYESQRL